MPDDLASAALDLAILPRADRAAILAALSRDERRVVEAAMRGSPPPVPGVAPLHSAWFDGLSTADHVTHAARAALAAAPRIEPAAEPARPGRSLIQAAGGLFAQAGARR
jgi:hypothetical protein